MNRNLNEFVFKKIGALETLKNSFLESDQHEQSFYLIKS